MDCKILRYIKAIRFVIWTLYPKLNSNLFIIYLAIRALIELKRKERYGDDNFHVLGLLAEVLPREVHKKIVKKILNDRPISDCCIIVPENIFYDLYSEELLFRDGLSLWVNMKVYSPMCEIQATRKEISYVSKIKEILGSDNIDKPHQLQKSMKFNKIERTVQIIPSSEPYENVAFVSETEYFNWIKSYGHKHILKNIKLKFSPLKMKYAPIVAEKIIVEMVNLADSIETDLQFVMLNEYFNTPKFLHQSDYFTIPLNKQHTKDYYFKYFDTVNDCKKLHFRCKSIQSKIKTAPSNMIYFIVKGVTEILQEENVNCFIPFSKNIGVHSHDDLIQNMYLDKCPFGMQKYFDKLNASIAPFIIDKEVSPLHSELKVVIQPLFLIRGCTGSGRGLLTSVLAEYNGLNFLKTSCRQLSATTAKQTEAKIEALLFRAKRSAPVIIYLQDFEVFAVDNEGKEDLRIVENLFSQLNLLYESFSKFPIIIFAGCSLDFELKSNIRRLFLEEFEINNLTTDERYEILKWMLITRNMSLKDINISSNDTSDTDKDIELNQIESINDENDQQDDERYFFDNNINNSERWKLDGDSDILIKKIASKTEGFLYEDLESLVYLASLRCSMDNKYFEMRNKTNNYFREIDFENTIENLRSMHNTKVTSLKIPNVQWEAVGGLDDLKKEIFRTIELPLKFPHLLSNSELKRSGILLWGPPGCGKTLVAKAIASQLKANFLSVKGPELLDMYVGQSEKNMREIFASARSAAPCVIFFDEAEAAAGARGASGDSGGAADRLVSQLLAELDGVAARKVGSESNFIIVIAATNRPDLVEPALLRPGRLDKLLYVGPYIGTNDKVRVLNASCRDYNLSDEVDLSKIAERLPKKCTGADLASVVNRARHNALRKTIHRAESGDSSATMTESDIVINNDDFDDVLSSFAPSISDKEMAYYESLKTKLA